MKGGLRREARRGTRKKVRPDQRGCGPGRQVGVKTGVEKSHEGASWTSQCGLCPVSGAEPSLFRCQRINRTADNCAPWERNSSLGGVTVRLMFNNYIS